MLHLTVLLHRLHDEVRPVLQCFLSNIFNSLCCFVTLATPRYTNFERYVPHTLDDECHPRDVFGRAGAQSQSGRHRFGNRVIVLAKNARLSEQVNRGEHTIHQCKCTKTWKIGGAPE